MDLVQYLRESVIVQDPNGITENDPAYLIMTDAELENVLLVAMSKDYGNYTTTNLPTTAIYPVILLAKKELYHRLSVKEAPLYGISTDGTSIRKGERFEHYFKLIQQVSAEYQSYLDTGTTIQAGNILISGRYYSQRNYNLMDLPSVSLKLDKAYTDKLELSWDNVVVKKFGGVKLYISTVEPIIDLYGNTSSSPSALANNSSLLSDSATLVQEVKDPHINKYRVVDLIPNTKYYLCLIISEANGLTGYSELEATTPLV